MVDTSSAGMIQVSLPIGDDSSVSDVHKMCTSDSSSCRQPRDACTDVILLEHGYYDDQPVSKLLLIPHTGRPSPRIINVVLFTSVLLHLFNSVNWQVLVKHMTDSLLLIDCCFVLLLTIAIFCFIAIVKCIKRPIFLSDKQLRVSDHTKVDLELQSS